MSASPRVARRAAVRASEAVGAAAVLLAGTWACGPPASGGPILRPGDSLFDHLAALRVEARPDTALPVAVRDAARRVLADEGLRIEPADWTPGGLDALPDLPDATIAALVATLRDHAAPGEDGLVAGWRHRLPLRVERPLGRPWLRHGGRALAHRLGGPGDGTPLPPVWLDERRAVLFLWDTSSGELLAFGGRPALPVDAGITVRSGSAFGVAERHLRGDARPPADARALAARLRLGPQDRACLVTPSPAVLAIDVGRLEGDALRLAAGVPDAGLSAAAAPHGDGTDSAAGDTAGGLAGVSGDGVTFAVDVTASGGTTRAWSRHVRPGEGFIEALVDLSDWTGEAVRLRLVTEPGPAGEVAFDHAAWADLRVQGPPRTPPARPHVVLVDIDTLRADRLGCYGYERPTTPRLDAWAAEQATIYTDAVAAANWTLPSTISLLSGLSVSQHGARARGRGFPPGTSVASRLREAGYETLAHTDGGYVGPGYGFADGFELFEVRSIKHGEISSWGDVLGRLAARRSERPVFCFLQTYLVHAPYEVDRHFAPSYDGPLAARDELPESFARDVRTGGLRLDDADRDYVNALYDAGVRRMDDLVGDLLDGLEQVFGGEEHLVVLTSDHGEEILDRGLLGHAHSLHREVLAVPLVVRFPGGDRVGVEHRPVSGLDVVPTILDVAGLPVPDLLPGRSLLRPVPPQRLRVSAQAGTHAVQLAGWKLMAGDAEAPHRPARLPRLVDLSRDPAERHDLSGAEPRRVAELAAQYTEHRARHPELPRDEADLDALDEETLADLRALGYLGDG